MSVFTKIFPLYFVLLFISCGEEAEVESTPAIPSPEINDLTKTIVYKSISGINPNLLSLDIYYNDELTDLKPIVIYVHGGAWTIGDKTNQISNKVNLFRSLDYIFVSINYRLSPFPFEPQNEERIKFPDHNLDVADAIAWVFDEIATYGGDQEKIALLGHSAGAHLVALTGTNERFLEDLGLNLSSIKGVAVIDTEGYDINEQVNNGSITNAYVNAFGTEEELHQQASPLLNINSSKHHPKFFIGKRGTASRLGYANEFISELQKEGVSVTQIDGSIYDHEGINNAIGDSGETLITEALKSFLEDCFK